jgi:hypothetical protein
MLDNGVLNVVSVFVGLCIALSLCKSNAIFIFDYEEIGLFSLAVAVVTFILLKFL